MASYVFVLCAPYCGSTVLWRLLGTSESVSSLPAEGQVLPEVKEMMYGPRRWDAEYRLPWQTIKEVWERYWDLSKPLVVEKSPPNLIRTEDIIRNFHPAYFIIMVRNPYAHSEGLMRYNRWKAKQAAEFSAYCLKRQKENALSLKNSVSFSYEELVHNPQDVCTKMRSLLPALGYLKYDAKLRAHSILGQNSRQLVDFNEVKMRNLGRGDIKTITDVLKESDEIMKWWGYHYYDPPRSHAVASLLTAFPFSRLRSTAQNVMSKLHPPGAGGQSKNVP